MAQFSSEATIAKGYRDISDRQNECGLRLLNDISVTSGGVVLDMGCGSGYLASVLAERVGPAGRVMAVDPDAGRIQVAEKDYKHVSNLTFSEGSTDSFPNMGGGVYDLYFSNHVIHRVPNKLEAFKNAFKCLKNGGKLAVHLGTGFSVIKKQAVQLFQPEIYDKLVSEMYFYESHNTVVEYCEKARFKVIQSFEGPVTWSYQDKEDFLRWLRYVTHGLFDLNRVTPEKLKLFNPPRDENGRPMNEYPESSIIAVKDMSE